MDERELKIPHPVDFLGCRLYPVTTSQFMQLAVSAAVRRRRMRITYLNAHCSNLAYWHPSYREAVNTCDLAYADGQGVVWATRLLGNPVPERVNAGDFIDDFFKVCAEKKLRVFLLGCAEGLAARAARAWQEKAPGLEIVGTHHGFFTSAEEEAIVSQINAALPDILIVGMSAPRQELWMTRWSPRLNVPVIWCVGALFEYFSNARARAPKWVRRIGLEWLFRLALEPRRLWKRYFIGNALFVFRVMRAKMRP